LRLTCTASDVISVVEAKSTSGRLAGLTDEGTPVCSDRLCGTDRAGRQVDHPAILGDGFWMRVVPKSEEDDKLRSQMPPDMALASSISAHFARMLTREDPFSSTPFTAAETLLRAAFALPELRCERTHGSAVVQVSPVRWRQGGEAGSLVYELWY